MIRCRLLSCAVVVFAAAATGCHVSAAPVDTQEHSRDSIRLDPGNPRLNFIRVEAVQESDAAPSVHLTGRISFDEDHTQRVSSPIDGRVTKILVQLGENVKPGQALVELSSPRAAELQAEAQKAEQDRSLAEKTLGRANKLKLEGAVSDKEVALAEADFKKAMADSARAGAQLRSLSLSASGPNVSASLRSQIAGTVVDRSILVGQEIRADASAPLLTITDLGTVWVFADLYEQDLALVTQGASVGVRVPAYPGEVFPGKVEHVGEVLDPVSHTVKLRCVVPNPGNRLKPEMFAKIELTDAGQRKTIVLPSKAILTDSEHTSVIVALEGNVYRQRFVETGPEADGKVRILSGIKPGDRIVTDGTIFLKREMESE
jgi:cobalt-zinc-cadmium efflux system membrane fusion protein